MLVYLKIIILIIIIFIQPSNFKICYKTELNTTFYHFQHSQIVGGLNYFFMLHPKIDIEYHQGYYIYFDNFLK